MELYLDSVNFDEIKQAADWGMLAGLTTTPTFMHRSGISNVDDAIVALSELVPLLHVEALGNTVEEIIAEAERQAKLPVKCELVFKIPVSNIGFKACRQLVNSGRKVNIHLIYTLNQAYLAMAAGATYVCPLVGRLHDQGHDAFALIDQCVGMANHYGYATKVMVSSVRHAEHVRQAIITKAHACTMPWSVMSKLASNTLTDVGTAQFVEHTNLMTIRIKDVLAAENPTCSTTTTILDALVQMTASKLGAVSVVNGEGDLVGIFTDGDVRRALQQNGKNTLELTLGQTELHYPVTLSPNALLNDAAKIFKEKQIDNIVVEEYKKPVGMLDIQDLLEKGFLS
jgi:transaldolase